MEKAKTISIDRVECLLIDEWHRKKARETYYIGQCISDPSFYMGKGIVAWQHEGKHICDVCEFEYDHKPTREEIESDCVDLIAKREIDRYETVHGADGLLAFPHLNDDRDDY